MIPLAAWQYSLGSQINSRGANEWLFSIFNRDIKYKLNPIHYREALRSRVLLKSFDNSRRCKCVGPESETGYVNPGNDPYHPILCKVTQGVMNTRHKNIEQPFLDLIKDVFGFVDFTTSPTLPK